MMHSRSDKKCSDPVWGLRVTASATARMSVLSAASLSGVLLLSGAGRTFIRHAMSPAIPPIGTKECQCGPSLKWDRRLKQRASWQRTIRIVRPLAIKSEPCGVLHVLVQGAARLEIKDAPRGVRTTAHHKVAGRWLGKVPSHFRARGVRCCVRPPSRPVTPLSGEPALPLVAVPLAALVTCVSAPVTVPTRPVTGASAPAAPPPPPPPPAAHRPAAGR